jgi:hypothetical protein
MCAHLESQRDWCRLLKACHLPAMRTHDQTVTDAVAHAEPIRSVLGDGGGGGDGQDRGGVIIRGFMLLLILRKS